MAISTSPLVNISLSMADQIRPLDVWTPFRAILERVALTTPA